MSCHFCEEKNATHYCLKCANNFCKQCIQICASCDFDFCKKDFTLHDCTKNKNKLLLCKQCKMDCEFVNTKNICEVCEFYSSCK